MNPLSHISSRELVGIDFCGSNLKIACMKVSANRRELTHVFTHNISGLQDSDISKIIKGTFIKLKAKHPYVINIISSHVVITKNIEIPSTNPREIQEIINLQASRYTPYSREEIITDYIDINVYKHSYTKILLVIVARNIAKRQFDILDKAGMKLEKVVLASEGLAWSAAKILKVETASSPISLMHIDDISSDFIIIFRNKPTFVRSISIGAQHLLSKDESTRLKFVDEIKKSFEAYQSEDIEKSPRALITTGAIDGLKDVEDALNDTLHLNVSFVSYFKNFSVSKEISKFPSMTEHTSFFSMIASLLAGDEVKVDLIPDEIKLRRSVEERGRHLIKSGILLLTVLILVFSILISKIYFKNSYLQVLTAKYNIVHKEAEKLEGQFERISLVKDYLLKRGYPLEILTELHRVAPIDLELNDIRFEQGAKFVIKGTARSMSIVFSLVDNMEKSKYFQDVKTRYTTKRKDGERDVTDFEVNCQLTAEAD